MWSAINSWLNFAFDLVLLPFRGIPTALPVIFIAMPTAVLALLAYRFASNQAGIVTAKNRILAYLLELRLYGDDLRVMIAAQGRVFWHIFAYMAHALRPMALMIVPIALIMIQVESRYAFRSLEPGEKTILSVRIAGKKPVSQVVASLSLPPTLVQETPALRVNSAREIHWRINAQQPGEYLIGIRIGDENVTRRIVVGEAKAVSPYVFRANDILSLLYPSAPAIGSDSQVISISLSYPRAREAFFGLSSASWILFAASMFWGFTLKGLFRVTF